MAETMSAELMTAPIPCTAGREGGRENHEEVKPGNNKGVRGRSVKIQFYFSLPCSDSSDNILISPS